MMLKPRVAATALLVAWLPAAGCTALREIPRGEYAAVPERKNVRVVTREGLRYELDFVRVNGDTLLGYRQRDTEGNVPDFATLRIPMSDVAEMSARGVDWRRTGLIGGAVVAVLAVLGLHKLIQDNSSDSSGGGKVPIE